MQARATDLVDLGLDQEELDERGRAVDGGVYILQASALLAHVVKVLGQEVLHPEQGGGRLHLAVVCRTHTR